MQSTAHAKSQNKRLFYPQTPSENVVFYWNWLLGLLLTVDIFLQSNTVERPISVNYLRAHSNRRKTLYFTLLTMQSGSTLTEIATSVITTGWQLVCNLWHRALQSQNHSEDLQPTYKDQKCQYWLKLHSNVKILKPYEIFRLGSWGKGSKAGFLKRFLISWKIQIGNAVKANITARIKSAYCRSSSPHTAPLPCPLFLKTIWVQMLRKNRAYLGFLTGWHTSLELEADKYGRGNLMTAWLLEGPGGSDECIYCCNLEPNA